MHFKETVSILSLKYGLNQYPEYVGQNLNSRLHAKKSGVMFLKPLLLPKKHGEKNISLHFLSSTLGGLLASKMKQAKVF